MELSKAERKELILKRINEAKGKEFEIKKISYRSIEETFDKTNPALADLYRKYKRLT